MAWSKTKQMRFLSTAPVIRVATVGRDCKPQVTPVCHIVWKDKVYWASDLDSVKLANLSRHPHVSLVADIYKPTWRNVGGVIRAGQSQDHPEWRPFFERPQALVQKISRLRVKLSL